MDAMPLQIGTCTLYQGDSLTIVPTLAENSLDAIITDPPYGLAFMGQEFDTLGDGPAQQAWHRRWAEAVYKVLKPGAFCLAFGGDRTIHRLICAIEDAGFEIRGQIAWIHAQGFPKSLDVSRVIDKAAGVEREVIGSKRASIQRNGEGDNWKKGSFGSHPEATKHIPITAPATDAAQQWDGFGTALKPAMELIVLARKPLIGTVIDNILAWGCGALNIDACRIPGSEPHHNYGRTSGATSWVGASDAPSITPPTGRWPANICHDGSEQAIAGFPDSKAGAPKDCRGQYNGFKEPRTSTRDQQYESYGDTGSAARYFFCAKASPSDRGAGNTHPTTKPTSLMRWLLRLVVPPGGVCLDLFAGSGTTGVAAIEEGYRCLLIEREQDYFDIMRRRCEAASRQPDLFRTSSVAPPQVNAQPSLFGEE